MIVLLLGLVRFAAARSIASASARLLAVASFLIELGMIALGFHYDSGNTLVPLGMTFLCRPSRHRAVAPLRRRASPGEPRYDRAANDRSLVSRLPSCSLDPGAIMVLLLVSYPKTSAS